ncbi:hypothetical protein [Zhenpiania hominis]|uniref:hypothetical protein n=1 Tax=Zhenpiania hominis TaxID=2763644 RepID=UPI0039F46569
MDKIFCTVDSQLHKLKSRGMIISDSRRAKRIIEKSFRYNLKPNSIPTMPLHKMMNIPINAGNNPVCGKNDLFAIVIIFRIILSKSSFNKFFPALQEQIQILSHNLSTISVDMVLSQMGFPLNWQEIQSL